MIQPNRSPSLTNYTAYLVRCWQDGKHAPWRASAQSVRTGEKLFFANLDELFAFLAAETETLSTLGASPTVLD